MRLLLMESAPGSRALSAPNEDPKRRRCGRCSDMFDLSVLGEAVNTASRLQHLAKRGDVVLGESAYARIQDRHPDLPLQIVTVEGKTEPVSIRTLSLT